MRRADERASYTGAGAGADMRRRRRKRRREGGRADTAMSAPRMITGRRRLGLLSRILGIVVGVSRYKGRG